MIFFFFKFKIEKLSFYKYLLLKDLKNDKAIL